MIRKVGLRAFFGLVIAGTLVTALSGCSSHASDLEQLELRKERVTFVGDSNTQAWAPLVIPDFPLGWGVDRTEQFPYQLLRQLEPEVAPIFLDIRPWESLDERSPSKDKVILGEEYAFFNAGVIGASTSDLRSLWPVNVSGRDSSVVVVCAGTNDMLHDSSLPDAEANIEWMGEQALAEGAAVVLCTIPPWDEATPEQARWMAEFNEWVREHCAESGFVLADFNRVLDPDGDGLNDYPLSEEDSLHVSAEGHRQMALAIPLHVFRSR